MNAKLYTGTKLVGSWLQLGQMFTQHLSSVGVVVEYAHFHKGLARPLTDSSPFLCFHTAGDPFLWSWAQGRDCGQHAPFKAVGKALQRENSPFHTLSFPLATVWVCNVPPPKANILKAWGPHAAIGKWWDLWEVRLTGRLSYRKCSLRGHCETVVCLFLLISSSEVNGSATVYAATMMCCTGPNRHNHELKPPNLWAKINRFSLLVDPCHVLQSQKANVKRIRWHPANVRGNPDYVQNGVRDRMMDTT